MINNEIVLSVEDLVIKFNLRGQELTAIRGASLSLYKGESLAIVGESGSGKSVFTKSFMGLLDVNGRIDSGSIMYKGNDLAKYKSEEEWIKVRGKEIAMVFQDPMTSLNPLKTVGKQVQESIELHQNLKGEEAKKLTVEILNDVGISEPERRYNQYPHEFSGGMRQRVVIAIAVACNPNVLVCDEPTTALDVTIQAQILDILRRLKDQINSSIMLITHDLGVIAEMADYVVVMYAGKIVEKGTAYDVFHNPCHPYTIGLMNSKPVVNKRVERLYSIPGKVPNPINMPNYCYFKDRCDKCIKACEGEYPPEFYLNDNHMVSCYLYSQVKEAQDG